MGSDEIGASATRPGPPAPLPDGEAPPFGGSWRRLYVAVLANLAFWIAVMAALTWAYR
ncbi:MAG TPA: hypothetical protein P5234_12270 [Thermoanaerobaculaceae bacterium]|nr:hypothetical protein [Thermoanaerobaculaceae bacterium]HRS17006.1 hypothetical protein [Thermoanaerobaculaceae bacterium]